MSDLNDARCPGFSQLLVTTRPDGLPIEWETFKLREWPGVRAQYRRFSGPITYSFSVIGNVHRFMLLDSHREDGEFNIGELTRIENKDLRNKLIYAGPTSDITGWSRIDNMCSFVLVELASHADDEIADIAPVFMRAGTLMKSILLRFKGLVLDEAAPIPNYAETLSSMLRQELIRIDVGRNSPDGQRGGLTARQLKKAIAYMDDRIDQEISIPEIATELGLSSSHFIRMFKKSAGMPPLRFFINRRIERARDLLRSPHLSISDVAEMSGFGGATQLTRAFRRIVGTNPSAFRRELL